MKIKEIINKFKKSQIIVILNILILIVFVIGLIIIPILAVRIIFIIIALSCLTFPIVLVFLIYQGYRKGFSNKILLLALLIIILFFGMMFANIGTTGIPYFIKYTAPIVCPVGFNEIVSEPSARQYDMPGLVFTVSRKIICKGVLGEYEPFRGIFVLSGMILYFLYCSFYFLIAYIIAKFKYFRKHYFFAQLLCLVIFIPILSVTILNSSFLSFVTKPVNRLIYRGHAVSLIESVRRHNMVLIHKLLADGGNINALNDTGESALTLAQRINDREILKLFGEQIAGGSDIKKNLLEKGIIYNKKSFFESVIKNDLESVKIFIQAGMDINTVSDGAEYGNTALSIASAKGHKDMVQLLLDNKADINKRGENGWAPLQAAAINGRSDIVLMLIKNDSQIDAKIRDGNTALMMAAHASSMEVIKILIENNASINARTKSGYSALLYAIEYTVAADERYEIVKYLLENGADPNVNIYTGTYEGYTPLRLERMRNDPRIIQLLKEYNARE